MVDLRQFTWQSLGMPLHEPILVQWRLQSLNRLLWVTLAFWHIRFQGDPFTYTGRKSSRLCAWLAALLSFNLRWKIEQSRSATVISPICPFRRGSFRPPLCVSLYHQLQFDLCSDTIIPWKRVFDSVMEQRWTLSIAVNVHLVAPVEYPHHTSITDCHQLKSTMLSMAQLAL